ncbi:MAG: glutathione S-transferase family protein [Pseudomonadota bacterium]
MTIQMYDLCGTDDTVRFSPYCWRTRMALKHKDLAFEALPWRFTEKATLEMSGQGRVPVIVDGEKVVSDSWAIALYLDETYPDRPTLMRDASARAAAQTLQGWTNTAIFRALVPINAKRVHDIIGPEDQAYFRQTREAALKGRLEDICSDDARADAMKLLGSTLKVIEPTLTDHAFLGGDEPLYGDHIVFGTLMWPHAIDASFAMDGDTAVASWFDRMSGLYGDHARAHPRAA